MKKLMFPLALALCFSMLKAQSPMEIGFGKTYDEVQTMLDAQPGASVTFESEDRITVDADGAIFHYSFTNGRLFKVEQLRSFRKVREADEMVGRFRDFFVASGAHTMNLADSRNFAHMAAVQGRQLCEVFRFETENKNHQVRTVRISLEYCPGAEMEAMMRDNNEVFQLVAISTD